jgi:hypothetical protein
VGLPYRDPGTDVVEWQRDEDSASLLVTAGKAVLPNQAQRTICTAAVDLEK